MDEFVLPIDKEKFRSTNQTWNSLMLNDPWSVGYVTTLIALHDFPNKESWESFYYQSGNIRNELLNKLSADQKTLLDDEQLVLKANKAIENLSWNLKNLNWEYGRTEEQLRKKGDILFAAVKHNGLNITAEECFECVRYRVICETWHGVILREQSTIRTLQQLMPLAEFKKVDGDFDYKFAVDYELYKNGRLFCGLQIKPKSYLSNAPYIVRARFANQQKNKLYQSAFGVPVFDIIASKNGEILNQEIIKNL